MSRDLHSYSSSIGRAKFHVSFIPKYRHKIFLYERVKKVCEHSFKKTAEKYRFIIKELGFDTDHLHIVLEIPPNYSISQIIKLLKGRSARKLFKTFPWLRTKFFWGGSLWSGAYFFDSMGDVNSEIVEKYVRTQGVKGDYQRTVFEFCMPPTLVGGS